MKKQITVTIGQSHFNNIEKLKDITDWSRSLIIREALKDFFNKYEGNLR
jgi:metal-responsive CopG/Arc/MetJ family transcriptional regulator